MQNKQSEIQFFDQFADNQSYNVFSPDSNEKIIRMCVELGNFKPHAQVIDLGCGSGVFTKLLQEHGLRCAGLDISFNLLLRGRQEYTTIPFIQGDVEKLPFATESIDGLVLSGLIHHLPDKCLLAREVFRVLKPGGSFVAFDPNRRNPFMWLYRDKSSPFYSSKGVTENERPIIAREVASIFTDVGFKVTTRYLSGLHYQYLASPIMRLALPIYNFVDNLLFRPSSLETYRAFVLTGGTKG